MYYPKIKAWKWIDNNNIPLEIVSYKTYLTEIAEKDKEIAGLKADLALNASMLARQTDMARDAEAKAKRLRNAISGSFL
jgi:hypothetical protein